MILVERKIDFTLIEKVELKRRIKSGMSLNPYLGQRHPMLSDNGMISCVVTKEVCAKAGD